MATTEAGHHPSRYYGDQDGVLHLNGTVLRTRESGSRVGAASAATVTAEEFGSDVLHVTKLTLSAFPVTLVDANVGGGAKVYDFPEGRVLVLGAIATVTPTTTSVLANTLNASKTLSFGVGSVQTVAQASGTLATTEQDIVGAGTCTSSATVNVAGTAGSSGLSTPGGFNGTTTAIDAFLNFGVPTANDIDGDATITVDGTIEITWIWLGDY